MRRTSHVGVLARHFFDRFFDKESISPQGDPMASIAQILGVLAVPSAFFVLLFRPLTMVGWELVGVRYFFLSFSMVVMGLAMVFEWDALFPDKRDYQILSVLPLKLRSLFLAKVVSLSILLGSLLVATNFFGVLFWPGIDARAGSLHAMGVHALVMLAGGLFMALALAGLHGILVTFLSGSLLRRVSVFLQTVLMGTLVMLFFLTPILAFAIKPLAKAGHHVFLWFPPFWFMGLYEQLRPAVKHPVLLNAGNLAWNSLWIATVVFLLTYLPGYRRHTRKVLEAPSPAVKGPGRLASAIASGINRTLLRNPVERAVFHFITETITRSMKHRLFLATYGGFGIALAVIHLASPKPDLLQLPLTLSFILVSGLRAAFNFPSELQANWAFQIHETNCVGEYVRAMRKWITLCAVVPLFAVLAPVEFRFFAWPAALFHIAFGLTMSLLLIDVMFAGFRKVPFTCSYLPGKVNLVGLGVIYIYGFTWYSEVMAGVEAWIVNVPWAAVAFFFTAAAAHIGLAVWRDRMLAESPSLNYEDPGDPAVRTLDLVCH